MSPVWTCQNCGQPVDAQYARVFGNEDDEVHACTNCSTHRAIARGAAVAPDRDGTLLVHRPGLDEPVDAVIRDEDGDDHELETATRFSLTDVHDQLSESLTQSSSTPGADGEAFAALVAK